MLPDRLALWLDSCHRDPVGRPSSSDGVPFVSRFSPKRTLVPSATDASPPLHRELPIMAILRPSVTSEKSRPVLKCGNTAGSCKHSSLCYALGTYLLHVLQIIFPQVYFLLSLDNFLERNRSPQRPQTTIEGTCDIVFCFTSSSLFEDHSPKETWVFLGWLERHDLLHDPGHIA